jgi:glycosyltransferase involved in cell wall biosynthesis
MSTNYKTLVILTPAFPGDESETVWVRPKQLFIKKLQDNFPSLQIIVLSFNYPFHMNEYRWRGIRIISFNGMYTRKLRRLLLWIRVWRKLKRITKDQPVTGIFSFWCGECALVGRHFANRYHIKHFIWISGMDAKKENKLVKWIRPHENELIAMSVFLVNEFSKNHSIKPGYMIPIGIDPLEFGESSGKKDIDILGVGTLNPFKQYDVLIHIVKELSDSFPEIKAVICGEGSERHRLEELIKELHLENNISLTGLIPHAEALQWMQRARVFLHPSAYEGFGAVCLEALYAGAYVISFCDPIQTKIDRWHIAKNSDEMRKKTFEILSDTNISQEPVLLYSMDDTAKAVMNLFDE